jgi:hypothetical protein
MAINPIQIQKFLGGIDYPCSKDNLVRYARDHGADERALDALRGMPRDNFQTPADVSKAIGMEE